MSEWNLPLIDYWDQTQDAITRHTLRLIDLGEPERLAACGQIRDAVRQRLAALTDSQLLQAAVSVVDDLYKFVNDDVLVAPALFAYLDAFGRTFTETVRARGYIIHYIVENQFLSADFLRRGPFELFPRVFKAAGFVYICPQHLAWQLMQADGVAASGYAEGVARYIDEARILANRVVDTCHRTGQHYVFLDADYEAGSLDVALQGSTGQGILSVFRNDAPIPGSTVSVSFPSQQRQSAG